jgi:hypothetical protein
MKIPKHSNEALKKLTDNGLFLYDYADFLSEDKKKIIAYQKWGRGYRTDIIEIIEDKKDG